MLLFIYILTIIDQSYIYYPYPFSIWICFFSVCSLHPVLTGPIRQISRNLSLPLSPPKIVLHPSISALPFLSTLYLICLIPSHLPSDFADSPCIWTAPLLDLLHISPVSSLASLIPLLSFPPRNCWYVLAIFGVLLPSSSSCCHISMKKELKTKTFHCSLAHAWLWMLFQDQEEPGIRQSQCRSMWRVRGSPVDPTAKEWHI